MEDLRSVADQAIDRANELTEEAWPDSANRNRLDEVLAYARVVIQRSDAALVSNGVDSELEGSLTVFVNAPEQVAAEFEPWSEGLLDQLHRLSVAQGRDLEQEMKNAATTFQRSARKRFAAIERKAEDARSQVEALTTDLAARRAEIGDLVEQFRTEQTEATDTRLAQFGTRVQELQEAAERHAASVETLLTEQGEAFRRVQDERAEEFREREQRYEAQIDELQSGIREQGESLVVDMEAMKDKSAKLVGAIGITGTAERYGEEFVEQRG